MKCESPSITRIFHEFWNGRQLKAEIPGASLPGFLSDDSGAITIDWVGLTAGVLLASLMAVYAIFGNGVSVLTSNVNSNVISVITDLDPGAAIQPKP